jgi:DNA invertase Pin-like site-specific DNA recombinase
MNISDLIQPRHLSRLAVIYVRQSSPNQVLNHQESQRLQYALKELAIQLGWHPDDIVVIVLDLCGRSDCLIADRDGVCDASSVNGRLLLGLKGQISEVELHFLRGRLTEGLLNKAKRGELALTLPTGLIRLESGEVSKHPDREVQSRLSLIFDSYLERRSLAKVVDFFQKQKLKVPRRDQFGDIHWKRPSTANIVSTLKNPAYAGAFAYGRSRTVMDEKTGKTRKISLPIEEWKICIRDKYPAYISWETFEKIYQMLRDNYSEYDRNKTRGVPREGKALLQGVVYCGQCGHKMTLQYTGGVRYICNYLKQHQGDALCQRLLADPIDDQVVQWFFDALSVSEIDLSASVLQEVERKRDVLLSARRKEVERLRYQARLAERQYQHTDPENRLVAAELEQRWEVALRELKEAEERLECEEQTTPQWAIPADLLEMLKKFGPRLPELWEQGLFDSAKKKTLLRSLIDKVVLQRVAADKVRARVVWRGGATTTDDVSVPVGSFAELSDAKEMEDAIVRMAREGQKDEQIAQWLTAQGHHSPMRDVVLASTVQKVRLQHRILHQPSQSHPRHVRGYLTVPQLAAKLEISQSWIHDRIRKDIIRVTKDASTKCYLFPDKSNTLRQFRQLIAGKISYLDY